MIGRNKILIVDDEPDLVELISYNLRKEGLEVAAAGDGESALRKLERERFDLLILDLMLPGIQGTDLCRKIKASETMAAIPILMLSAKSEEMDRVLGLELGADDYVTKPFSVRELIARVRAVLRRSQRQEAGDPSPSNDPVIRYGALRINRESYAVLKGDVPLKLSATEFRLLLFLVERKGRVFTRDQLLNAVWRNEAFVEPRTVDVHIRRLRAQIEDEPSAPRYIRTRRGIGYFADGEV